MLNDPDPPANSATTGDDGSRFNGAAPDHHILFIYSTANELTSFAIPFVKAGLAKGERCVYVADDRRPSEIREALSRGGVEVDSNLARGALVVISGHEYAGPPPFIPARMADLFRKWMTEATASEFAGLRIAVETTWMVTLQVPPDTFVEFEALADELIGAGAFTLACMFREDRFDPAVLRQLVRTHRTVLAKDPVLLMLSAVFRNLGRAALEQLVRSAQVRRVAKSGFYFHQGDPATQVYVLTHGVVKLVWTDHAGRGVILRIVQPIETLGERPLVGHAERRNSAQAMTDARALSWDPGALRRQLEPDVEAVWSNWARGLEDRLEDERARFEDLATLRPEPRLARLLRQLARSLGRKTLHGLMIDVPFSGQDLAELVVTSPFTVSRILAKWRRLQIVDAQRERIFILNQERLAVIAETDREPEPGSQEPNKHQDQRN